jgi:hypothetical protein
MDARKLKKEVKDVEGKVFEKLVQTDPDLTDALFKLLGISKVLRAFCLLLAARDISPLLLIQYMAF